MYQVNLIRVPKGQKMKDCINEIFTNAKTPEEIEEAKDKIFRLTYKFALDELKKHQHLTTIEDGLSDMSIAFMKTFNNFDPTKEGASFLNYYKLTLKTELIRTKFRKYRNSEEDRELCYRMEMGFASLDEPIEGKDHIESGTKGDLIPSDYEMDISVLDNDLRERVLAVGNKAYDSIARRKEEYRPIFLRYLESATTEDPLTAKDLARVYGVSYFNIRRILLKYVPIFIEMWKGENEYE